MCVDKFDFEFFNEWIVLCFVCLWDVVCMFVVCLDGFVKLGDYGVCDLLDLLLFGDVLVFNDMKVILVQLEGKWVWDGIEVGISVILYMWIVLDYWKVFVCFVKKFLVGDMVVFEGQGIQVLVIVSEKLDGGEVFLMFD